MSKPILLLFGLIALVSLSLVAIDVQEIASTMDASQYSLPQEINYVQLVLIGFGIVLCAILIASSRYLLNRGEYNK